MWGPADRCDCPATDENTDVNADFLVPAFYTVLRQLLTAQCYAVYQQDCLKENENFLKIMPSNCPFLVCYMARHCLH